MAETSWKLAYSLMFVADKNYTDYVMCTIQNILKCRTSSVDCSPCLKSLVVQLYIFKEL